MRNDLNDHECNLYCRTPLEECLVQLLLTGSIITPKTDVLLPMQIQWVVFLSLRNSAVAVS